MKNIFKHLLAIFLVVSLSNITAKSVSVDETVTGSVDSNASGEITGIITYKSEDIPISGQFYASDSGNDIFKGVLGATGYNFVDNTHDGFGDYQLTGSANGSFNANGVDTLFVEIDINEDGKADYYLNAYLSGNPEVLTGYVTDTDPRNATGNRNLVINDLNEIPMNEPVQLSSTGDYLGDSVLWNVYSDDRHLANVTKDGQLTATAFGKSFLVHAKAFDGTHTYISKSFTTTTENVLNETKNMSYTSIQTAINEASNDDSIVVGTGVYYEQLIIDKPLTLLGPNANKSLTVTRKDEATILYPLSVENTLEENLVKITSDNVAINGFSFLNSDESLWMNEAPYSDIEALYMQNISFLSNVVESSADKVAIRFLGKGSTATLDAYGGIVVKDNKIISTGGFTALYLQAIGATVENNEISGGLRGLQVQPYDNPTGGIIRNNTIAGYESSIYHNSTNNGSGMWTYEGNLVIASDVTNPYQETGNWHGIQIRGFNNQSSEINPHIIITNNTIDGSKAIMDVDNDWNEAINLNFHPSIDSLATYLIEGNLFKNFEFAVKDLIVGGYADLTTILNENTFENCVIIQDQAIVFEGYKVRFLDFDESLIVENCVLPNQGATSPIEPTREAYTFTGWDTSFDNVTSNLIVRAEYKINTYTVTFMDADDTVVQAPVTVEHGNDATAPTPPAVEGYAFKAWNTVFTNVTSDLTVKATYTKLNNPTSIIDQDDEAEVEFESEGLDEAVEFTEEERLQDVSVKLQISVLNEDDVNEDDKALLEKFIEETLKIDTPKRLLLDISLLKVVGDTETAITNALSEVTIRFVLPEEYRGLEFDILRVHEGKVDILEYTFDEETFEVAFKTDKFSTYSLVAANAEEKEETPIIEDEEKEETLVPDMSDNSYKTLGLFTLLLGALLVLFPRKKLFAKHR